MFLCNAGNEGLCGKPLSSCKIGGNESRSLEPNLDSPDSKGKNHRTLITAIIVVAVIAFSSIVALLFIHKHRRKRFKPRTLPRQGNSQPSVGFKESHSVDMTGDLKGGDSELNFVREDRGGFDLHELLSASAAVLGSGSFGSTYKAMILNGPTVVVKRFRHMNNVGKQEFNEHMQRLGTLTHPNLLPLAAFYHRKEDKFLVYDFAENGSLASHLHGIYLLKTAFCF